MDFDQRWTVYALTAEEDAFGFSRIAQAHNTAVVTRDERIAELESKLARWRKVARAAVLAADTVFNSEGQWSGNDSDDELIELRERVEALSEDEREELLKEEDHG